MVGREPHQHKTKMTNKTNTTTKATENIDIKIGDKFYSLEGYNCTYYNFIVVEEISKTGKSFKCKQLEKQCVERLNSGEKVKPSNKTKEASFICRKRFFYNETLIRGKFNEERELRNFHKIKENEVFIETLD